MKLTPMHWAFHGTILAAVPLSAVLVTTDAHACTTFLAQHGDQSVVAKSYDWDQGAGLVLTNARGLAKRALLLDGSTPATWTSTYGSLTFNQYGAELPNGGMNEAGLVVEIMWLSETVYPPIDDRAAVTEIQWVQYVLDRFATVGELVDAAPAVRVSSAYADIHYLVCDAIGACAAFEYLGGELVITAGAALVVPTLTNDTYADSAAYLALHGGYGGTNPIPNTASSLDRFVRASSLAQETAGAEHPGAAFYILDSVRQDDFTQWNIVYATGELTVHFRTQASPSIKQLDLTRLDFGCDAPRRALSIDSALQGDVTDELEPYTMEMNRALLDVTLGDLGAEPLVIAVAAAYPDTVTCEDPDAEPITDPGTAPAEGQGSGSSSGGGCSVRGPDTESTGWLELVGVAVGLAWRRRRRAGGARAHKLRALGSTICSPRKTVR